MGENGYFAGETETGTWEIFDVGPMIKSCATEAEAVAEVNRLTLLQADRLENLARSYEKDADEGDDFGEHVGVVNSVRRRARLHRAADRQRDEGGGGHRDRSHHGPRQPHRGQP